MIIKIITLSKSHSQASWQSDLTASVSLTLAGRLIFMWVLHKGHKSPYTVARDKVLVIYMTVGALP